MIVEKSKKIIGLITAYKKPDDSTYLFVWQVAVISSERGKGIALKMLEWLIQQPPCADVNIIETSVSPSNISSESLFVKFSKKQNTKITKSSFLEASQFGNSNHEGEMLFQIKLKKMGDV